SVNVRMKQFLRALPYAMLCALVTGCPSNDYTVELKPNPDGTIQRTLTFYRADGVNSNGVPNYEDFPSNELTSIASVYPAGAIKTNGLCYVAMGEFSGSMPRDLGGVGSYTNFATSLGDAGIYMERFCGTDDLAGQLARRFQAADQLDDLAIGWTRTQFGNEAGYTNLYQFLDGNFRQDLKNGGFYAWMGEVNNLSQTNSANEYIFRFFQYLYERGYVKLSDERDVYLLLEDEEDDAAVLRLLRRILMDKMNVPASGPVPKSFAVLNDTDALDASWENYLTNSASYQARLKEWQSETNANPALARPKSDDVASDPIAILLFGSPIDFSGETDHLTVKLKLTHAPDFTNGKWQDGQAVWSLDFYDNRPLPALCYAGWSDPNTQFQTNHFGSVLLDDALLSQYCFWQGTLSAGQAREWESFLATLKPGPGLKKSLENFQFTGDAAPETINGKQNYGYVGRKLLLQALENESVQTTPVTVNSK
ncbi:MAG TPA: hypothetical protein VMA13_07820, partial [Candidatus Saccharimonadales bacterium]|nr:hypothetical protein [Candidatus Saccharimonadales bacterium]